MLQKAEWLTHGDELLVDSLHDILEGPDSIFPVAMAPTKRAAAPGGFGRIVAAGIILGLVIGVSTRLLYATPLTATAPKIAARLSEPLVARMAAQAPDMLSETASVAERDDEMARSADEELPSAESKRRARGKRRAKRRRASVANDIYAAIDTHDEALSRRARLMKSIYPD